MFVNFIQAARRQPSGFTAAFRHLGAFGLFGLAILDSLPIPTLGGPDILIVILVVTRKNPWFEYAAVATVGSLIGAYITYRLAHRAGRAYMESKFGSNRAPALLSFFEKWGTGALVASTAIPFPFPTSVFFAAAGASNYDKRRFVVLVTICRAFRYAAVALVADIYGRRMIRVFRHPTQYWGWLLLFAIIVATIMGLGVAFKKRLGEAPAGGWNPGHAESS